jgi:dihydrofolate reductase
MGRIVISTNVSLDGVVQDPDGREGFSLGGWFAESIGGDYDPWAKVFFDEALNTEALLLGRRSLPKYVVSSTLDEARWSNATVVNGDVVAEVATLKRELEGDIVVYASYQLARELIEADLVDEIRLFVFPVAVGGGERLFGETSGKKPLRLVDSRTVGDGLARVTYEFA